MADVEERIDRLDFLDVSLLCSVDEGEQVTLTKILWFSESVDTLTNFTI